MKKQKSVVLVMVIALIWTFGLGYATHWLFNPKSGTPNIYPTPTPTQSGHNEYDLLLATTSDPPMIYYIDHFEYDFGYGSTYMYYSTFNDTLSRINIPTDALTIYDTNDGNRDTVSVTGGFDTELGSININIPEIALTMTVRSGDVYTKFGGSTKEATGEISINGEEPMNVYAALLKGGSSNYPDVDVYKLGVRTDWLMYWDKDWNFYHLDKTSVNVENDNYLPHEFFSRINSQGDSKVTRVDYLEGFQISTFLEKITITQPSLGTDTDIMNLKRLETVSRPYYEDVSALSTIKNENGEGVGVYIILNTR
ncbi:hypothetical protein KC614_00040 [candidate division WWE3 bacterium]|uniref:Uncharacterized protein n=1 Tax=candidate division WWE3 bacterium TaxID=2053526 RepID=A0A955LIY9_UNCKA|nr:hypothetical protein [candidate division WWE3 bacterium]